MDASARLDAAEAFLQEAVYRSRGAQAGASLLAPDERPADERPADERPADGGPADGGPADGGQCGLGARAAVVLDLSPKAEGLFTELWPDGVDEAHLVALEDVMRAWVERQDALDRKRNHFLKAFRGEHGFDRSAYDPGQAAAYREGLDAVNGEVSAERREVAEALLAAALG